MQSSKSEPQVTRGKLGFFDSWVGGLAVMAEFRALYPDLDIVYFGDRANCPYGARSPEDIRALTLAGVERLVAADCVIIILACNTAATHAIQYLQQIVYHSGSGVKILGVTVPGVESALEAYTHWSIGVLATQATANAHIYSRKLKEGWLEARIPVYEVGAPGLTDIIEGAVSVDSLGVLTCAPTSEQIADMENLLSRYLREFAADTKLLILGCTHYPIISDIIRESWQRVYGTSIILIDPGAAAAKGFGRYLEGHREFEVSRRGSIVVKFSGD